jgi:hypothetical protein
VRGENAQLSATLAASGLFEHVRGSCAAMATRRAVSCCLLGVWPARSYRRRSVRLPARALAGVRTMGETGVSCLHSFPR